MSNLLREFFYLRKSDRKVILALLSVIAVALGIIMITGDETQRTNALAAADTVRDSTRRDSLRYRHYKREPRVYVRTKIIYRDTAFSRGSGLRTIERDTLQASRPRKIKPGEHIDLSTADTTCLQTIPGIGPYYARKVVDYGERLGGYVSIDQLDEIEGFPLDAKAFLTISDTCPRKLNVNRLSLSELRRHPYISFYQARAITDYRRLHGPLRSLSDLRLSRDFPPEAIRRLEPYVEF